MHLHGNWMPLVSLRERSTHEKGLLNLHNFTRKSAVVRMRQLQDGIWQRRHRAREQALPRPTCAVILNSNALGSSQSFLRCVFFGVLVLPMKLTKTAFLGSAFLLRPAPAPSSVPWEATVLSSINLARFFEMSLYLLMCATHTCEMNRMNPDDIFSDLNPSLARLYTLSYKNRCLQNNTHKMGKNSANEQHPP